MPSASKRLRQGQILKLVADGDIASQDDLRRKLAHAGMRVTQATLSRDLQELRLVKTAEGYRVVQGADTEEDAQSRLVHALKEFLLDVREAQNLLVLKTPPGGAQPLAAALDAGRLRQVAGTIAGDDTVLVVTPSRRASAGLQKRMRELLK
ncbi:MAG TPA: ArgR family transcriptional regulator [Terriglobia bacterium]|nr:ArgR family transcriptional regulator [Terriglobia bacterium]